MSVDSIAAELKALDERIIIIFAFNATGKTRLSVAYKDITKNDQGEHSGIYFNAYSEDLFAWDNDEKNNNADMRLLVHPSTLNQYHRLVDEERIRDLLQPYCARYDFRFRFCDDETGGIDYISFLDETDQSPIKISRGEERIFIWCFFLALFEVEDWADKQAEHLFIDDPVTSLDDHNLYVTASSICDLIREQHENRRIILTTHHFGLYMVIRNYLSRGEMSASFSGKYVTRVLREQEQELVLSSLTRNPVLSHLRTLQLIQESQADDSLAPHHFVLLRQVLETVGSFLGSARPSHVLEQIGMDDPQRAIQQINGLSHKNLFRYEPEQLDKPDRDLLTSVVEKLLAKYDFVTHA